MPAVKKKTKARPVTRKQTGSVTPPSFAERLVLTQWFFSLFGSLDFDDLTGDMKDFRLEGYDENGVSPYLSVLKTRLVKNDLITGDMLVHFDNNIFRFTREINAKREDKIQWKYFQYLSLLFTEIYLFLYFNDNEALQRELNSFREKINRTLHEKEHISPFNIKDMNKLAFWNATGSGKTLIMHINIKQYTHYYNKHNKDELKSIILLTPNVGLSQQHYDELNASSIPADFFDKNTVAMYKGNRVAILDIYKLEEQEGKTTISAESLEGNNLVLVDEGHRGSSGEKWIALRNQICEQGFSFEYSATFGQAVGSSFNNDNILYHLYAKCILFDYSYKFFYKDGYGKDYHILNMPDRTDKIKNFKYLCAALLTFFQQKILFENEKEDLEVFNIENPLIVFVGSSVIGKKASSQKEKETISDVAEILIFLDQFISDGEKSIGMVDILLSGDTGLLDSKKNDIFGSSFNYLKNQKYTGKKAYKEMLSTIFNASTKNARLHVDNLRGIPGEVGLRAGSNDYFGVINIGEDTAFLKICEDHGVLTGARDFTDSLFQKINTHDSKINILIGSKKFSEGWNSWRVSTMGLINVGQSEGTQIIQLFGRGVRLKGYKHCLKRSPRIHPSELDHEVPINIHLSETLNIFGIKADYIQKFKEMLEKEGVPDKEKSVHIHLDVKQDIKTDHIKMLHLKSGTSFLYQAPITKMGLPPDAMKKRNIVLNWYPKIDDFQSEEMFSFKSIAQLNQGFFIEQHLPFIDFDSIYFELNSYKKERNIHNLIIDIQVLPDILNDTSWYTLYIPEEDINGNDLSKIQTWNDIALILFKKYVYRFYHFERGSYEKDKREYISLKKYEEELTGAVSRLKDESLGNLINRYSLEVPEDETDFISYINKINGKIKSGDFSSIEEFIFADPLIFSQHLYKPLLYMNTEFLKQKKTTIKVAPDKLEDSEYQFVCDLRSYYNTNQDFFKGKEIYLLRNRSRGRGLGFFEADNFYPDFIMWVITDQKQYITFIDPKGLVHIDQAHPKIQFSHTIKNIEKEIGDESVILNSFILSFTEYNKIKNIWNNMSRNEVEELNVLFMIDDSHDLVYIDKLFHKILNLPYSERKVQEELFKHSIVLLKDYKTRAYKDALPLYSLKAACGKFGEGQLVEPEGWVEVLEKKGMGEGWFVAQAKGHSMEPQIKDGDFCIFRPVPAGTKEGRILLVQHHDADDPDTGGKYSIKKYSKNVEIDENGNEIKTIVLEPINREYEPIVLQAGDEDVENKIKVIGEFVRLYEQ